MLILNTLLALASIGFAGYLIVSGLLTITFFRKQLDNPYPDPVVFPKVGLIVPCKDLDPDFEENMRMLPLQDYPNYEIFFVTVDEHDPSYPILKQVASESKVPARVLFGGFTKQRCQKLDNIIAAIEAMDDSIEVFAWVDSDARVHTDWLRSLVAPLREKHIGATTSYRWYVPIPGRLMSYLLCLWTGLQFSNFYNNRYVSVWGGSMAMRRDTYHKLDIRKHWEYALADDCVLNERVKEAGLRVEFVANAMTSLSSDYPLKTIGVFATRQCVIGKFTLREVWVSSTIALTFIHAVMLWALYQIGTGLAAGTPIHWTSWAMFAFWLGGLIQSLCFIRVIRLIGDRRPLEEPLKGKYRWALFVPLAYLFTWSTLVAAGFTNRFVWREIWYEMVSAYETNVYKYPERFS